MIEARKFMHTVVFEGVIIFQMQECASMNKVFIGVLQARLEAPKKKMRVQKGIYTFHSEVWQRCALATPFTHRGMRHTLCGSL